MRQDTDIRKKLPSGDPVWQSHQAIRERTGGLWTDVGVENAAAHSGSEPHDVWFNLGGERFADLGGLSGFRDRGDGRVLVAWDPDGDGLLDLAAVHSNAPRLRLYENRLGARGGGAVTLRLQGGARGDDRQGWSNVDAVGAVVRARVGDKVVSRTVAMGQGMASQSTAAVHIGLGDAAGVTELTVRWPGGKVTELGAAARGESLRVEERGAVSRSMAQRRPRPASGPAAGPTSPHLPAGPALVTTFATWCTACAEEIPELAALLAAEPGIALRAVPVDRRDDADMVAAWVDQHAPPWQLAPVPPESRDALRAWVTEQLGYEAVPTTLWVDERGRVTRTWAGPPTLSQLRGP